MIRKRFQKKVLLQLPISLLFGYFTNLFNNALSISPESHIIRILLLAAAIVSTALGVVFILKMNIAPCAPDGLTNEISNKINKSFGFTKNIVDGVSVSIAIIIGLVFGGRIIGIGIGTLVSVIFIGRFIALFSFVLKNQLEFS